LKYIKVSELAGKLNISRSKAYQVVKEGKIPSVNIDGCIRVPEDYVDNMLYRQIEEWENAGNE